MIYATNNRIIVAEEIKTIRVMIKNIKEKAIEINIYRVLYIPQYSKNLLLEDQLDE